MLLSRSLIRRLRRSPLCRILLLIALVFILDSVHLLTERPPRSNNNSLNPTVPAGGSSKRSVFIASIHHNTAPLLHGSWNRAVTELAEALGPDNVYFSGVQFASKDATGMKLKQLKNLLDAIGVSNTIDMGTTGWQMVDDLKHPPKQGEYRPGWVRHDQYGRAFKRRIPLYVEARNRALETLAELAASGRTFDTVLFIDDVVFRVQDALELLDTHGGDYAAACSVHVDSYGRLQDVSALREYDGHPPASPRWPWFWSGTARAVAKAGDPVPVYSCWGGLVAFDAAPFYANPPLRFRAVDDSLAQLHVDASEGCLIHADNPLGASQGVWLNTKVRVGRGVATSNAVFPSWTAALFGSWANRISRWRSDEDMVQQRLSLKSRLAQWAAAAPEEVPGRDEPGLPCLMDDMQVLWQDKWIHI